MAAFAKRGREQFSKLPPIENTLKDKKILVVGATQGIGFEAAKQIGEKGAHVIFTARTQSKGQETLKTLQEAVPNTKFEFALVDLMDFSSIDKSIEDLKKYAPLDVVVLNAGVAGFDQERETFDKIMKTNVYGTIRFSEKSVEILKEGGRIIIISAELANPGLLHKTYWDILQQPKSIQDPFFKDVPFIQIPDAWFLFYSVSKGAEVKYVELAAKDPIYTKKNIDISTCTPGWNSTNLNKNADGAPFTPPQGALSIVWQAATSQNLNGGFYTFGQKLDPNEPFSL